VRIETLPTISSIQRTAVVVAMFVAAILLIEASSASAISCILGAALMIANLSALNWTVRVMFALARQGGGATGLGLIAAPLKMLLMVGITYLIIQSGRVNLPGFIAGTLTQFIAIFIEVGRAAIGNKRFPLEQRES
jgi:hypothetical protein